MNKYLQVLFPSKEEAKKKSTVISSLAPKVLTKEEDIEKVQPYLDKLNETIDTKGINNIALTGGYGSGKSTIIATFKDLNPQYKFLNISLASFNKKENDDSLTASEKKLQKEELERLLEVSILQQIFYHVKPAEIPESRFKRIINIPEWKIWSISTGFILWVSSSVLLLKYNYLDKINPSNWNTKDKFDWFALIIFIIAFIGLGLFSKLIVKLFSNSKINKVNIKGELELGDNINKSVFNEHLEEILYFFERTKYDVILIEDLDRFDSTDIFTKLREINILLNNSKLINREINFVYAVGDDLFEDKKERVKFFEYIIPVIPFINSSNADEQLRTLIKESGLDENIFTKEFISDVTTFIDDIDMRLLTNIFHEFVIYRKTLKSEFIKKDDELFAMITYKNIDPKDFTKLNRKEGKLYKLINNKRSYIKKFISILDKNIDAKNIEIKNIDNENISDIKELRRSYVNQILTKFSNSAIYLNEINIAGLIEDIRFNNLIKNEEISYRYFRQNYYDTQNDILNFNFSEIENEVNSDFTYQERVKLIESKHNNKNSLLQREVEKLKFEKIEIENWDLKQIFNNIDINEYLNDFSNNGLLRNFILNGYINENYNDYISLFHEVSITKEDFTFERNVKAGYSTEFNYKLSDKIENLVERIDLKYFKRETILNFNLLDYLGNNYNKYSDEFDSVIRLLSSEKEKATQFIDEYIKNEDRPLGIFIEKLVENWRGFWDYIYSKSNYTEDRENRYLELIIRFSNVETILNNQNNNTLRIAIEEKAYFLSIIKNTDELDYFGKISELLTKLNVEFARLDNPNEGTKKLFDYVYNYNLYKINRDNVLQMFLLFGKDSMQEEFDCANYSTILKSECEPMIEYINSNITMYVDNVYLKMGDNKSEDEIFLIKLLNNKELNGKSKVKIIQKVDTKINDIWSIDELDIKEQLLINNKLMPTWENVIEYYKIFDNLINKDLITFLNFESVYTQLSQERMIFKSDSFDYASFREKLLLCNELSDESYRNILKSSIYIRHALSFEQLNENKVVYLVDNILNTTKANYDILREHFPNKHITLIEKDFEKIIDKSNDFETDEDDVLMLLKSEKISPENKFNYVSVFEQNIITESKEISKIVSNIILQESTKIEFEYETIESLVKNGISTENKVRLVNLYIDELENSNIVLLLKNILGYEKLFEKGKPTYAKSDFNEILFGKLKKKNLIKNYYDDSWNDSNYRITTNH